MKNKCLACLLAVALLCSALLLPSCSLPPEVAVVQAYAKTALLSEYDGRLTMNTSLNIPELDVSMEIPLTVDMKVKDALSTSPKIAMVINASANGETVTQELYSDGRNVYIPSAEGGIKLTVDEYATDDTDIDSYHDTVFSLLSSLPDDILVASTITEEGDTITVTSSLSEEQLDEFYGDLLDDVTVSLSEQIDVAQIDVTASDIALTVKDTYVESYFLTLRFEILTSIAGSTYTVLAISEIGITLNDPGKPVTVTMPEGYESYGHQ